jgi:hypothetical protein
MRKKRSGLLAAIAGVVMVAGLVVAGTTANAATTAPRAAHPAAATPAKGPGPRGEFTDGHIAIRGLIRGHNYCISTVAHPEAGSFLYMAPCEPRDIDEWWHCVKYYSFGACTSAANPRLDIGQAGRSPLAQMVRPDHAGKNWILQFLPLSGGRQQVSVIRLPGFHGLFLMYPYTPHRVNPVFWGSGRQRGWGNEVIIGNGWHTDP